MKRLLILLISLIPTAAFGHSWYSMSCCSEHDCAPVDASEVAESAPEKGADGTDMPCWTYLPLGLKFCGSMIHPSEDAHFHVCFGNRHSDGPHTPYCIYIQNNM